MIYNENLMVRKTKLNIISKEVKQRYCYLVIDEVIESAKRTWMKFGVLIRFCFVLNFIRIYSKIYIYLCIYVYVQFIVLKMLEKNCLNREC